MTTDDKNGNEVKKAEETKPVVWTPEDASRFLTSAIHEAQRPLADALKQRPITTRALFLLVGLLVIAGLAIALILANQLEKAEARSDAVQVKHDSVFAEKHELQAAHTTLSDRMAIVSDQHNELKGHVDNLRKNEDVHKRTKTDLSRFRRHNEALRGQISGLEMEKSALARQLDAIKRMMEEPAEDEDDDLPFDMGNAIDDHLTPELAAPRTTTPDDATDENDTDQDNDSADQPEAAPFAAAVSETSSIVTGRESVSAPEPVAEPAAPAATLRPPEPDALEKTAEPAAEPEMPASAETPADAPADAPIESAKIPESDPVASDNIASDSADKAKVAVSDTASRAAAALEKAEEALRSRTSALEASLLSPDKYQSITDQAIGEQEAAPTAPTGEAEGDHFRDTSAAYGEQLSQPSESTDTTEETDNATGADSTDYIAADAHAIEDADVPVPVEEASTTLVTPIYEAPSAIEESASAEEGTPTTPDSSADAAADFAPAEQPEGDDIDHIVIEEITPETDTMGTPATDNGEGEYITLEPQETVGEIVEHGIQQVEETLENSAAQ